MRSSTTTTILTEEVLSYQDSNNNRDCLFNKIYLFVYYYPVNRGYLQEELASDFLLFLIPKIERIISRYRFKGVSFEVYLRNIIYWQIKTFTQLRKEVKLKEQIYTKFFYNCFEKISFYDKEPGSFEDDFVCNPAHPYTKSEASPYIKLTKSVKGRKKILVIALIHATTLQKSVISGVSSTCSIPLEKLDSWIQELKDSLDSHYDKVQKLSSQRNSIFFSLLELQAKMHQHPVNSDAHLSDIRKISLFKSQLKHLHAEVKHAKGKIHYDKVAEVLDIPSGTVASTVFYVRKLAEQQMKGD